LKPMIDEFRKTDSFSNPKLASLHWAIANAIEYSYDDSYFYEIAELVKDSHNGQAR
jgi:hypothetical protein